MIDANLVSEAPQFSASLKGPAGYLNAPTVVPNDSGLGPYAMVFTIPPDHPAGDYVVTVDVYIGGRKVTTGTTNFWVGRANPRLSE